MNLSRLLHAPISAPGIRRARSYSALVLALFEFLFYCFAMQATLNIPDELEEKLGADRGLAERALRRELSLVFYSRGWLGAGRAADYGEMSRREFEELLTSRCIERPLTASDLEQEFDWAATR